MTATIVFTSTHFSIFENVKKINNFYGFMNEEMVRIIHCNGEKTVTYPKSIIYKIDIEA